VRAGGALKGLLRPSSGCAAGSCSGTAGLVENAGGSSPWTGDLSNVTGKAAAARNQAIDAVIAEDFADTRLTHRPQHSPFAATGVAKRGVGTQIGPKSFESRGALRDTIVHEELHHRWWERGIPSPHHAADAYVSDELFYEVLSEYKRMSGW